jgi:hypothetical protein
MTFSSIKQFTFHRIRGCYPDIENLAETGLQYSLVSIPMGGWPCPPVEGATGAERHHSIHTTTKTMSIGNPFLDLATGGLSRGYRDALGGARGQPMTFSRALAAQG